MRSMLHTHAPLVLAVLTLAAIPAASARAQDAPTPAAGSQPGTVTRAIGWASTRFGQSGGDGFYPELGHMVPGTGAIKGGPGYRHHLFAGRAVVDASAAVSSRRSLMARTAVEWPEAFGGHAALAASARYQDATQINYFGIGAASARDARTDYRLKSLEIGGSVRVPLGTRFALVGGSGVVTRLSINPGSSALVPSIEQRFTEATAPGLGTTPRYLQARAGVERDSRDIPGYATRGGLYRVEATVFEAMRTPGQNFQRMDAEAVQHIPLAGERSGLTLHGRVVLSRTSAGNTIPFYLLPTLGGTDTLRGYTDYRFRDRDSAMVNVEYRWRVFRLVDAAAFSDIGTVAASAGRLLREPRSRDYGAGIRVHSEQRALARIDVARGAEGTRFLFSLTTPFGASRHAVAAPYVP